MTIILHASDVNPTDYALIYLVGAGLKDAEITAAFARMIHRKIKATDTKMEFPVSLDTLFEKLTENMDVESSRGIKSLSSHDLRNKNVSKVHFASEMTNELYDWNEIRTTVFNRR